MSLRVTVQVQDRIEFAAGDLSPLTDKEKLTRAWEVLSAAASLITDIYGPDAVTVQVDLEYGPLERGGLSRQERFMGQWSRVPAPHHG